MKNKHKIIKNGISVTLKNIILHLLPFIITACGSTDNVQEQVQEDPIEAQITLPIPTAVIQRPMLVVQVSYNDVTFINDSESWRNKLFGNNPNQLNHYYNEVSQGQFVLLPVTESQGIANDGIISVGLNKNHPDSGYNDTIHPDLREALEQANAYIDYSLYDINADGTISSDELVLLFVIAGNEDAYSGDNLTKGVWAHQSCTLSTNSAILDGVSLMDCNFNGNYALFGERHDDHDATVGIIAHELGHSVFSLPDLYDIDYSSGGIGYFGLMGSGTWGWADNNDFAGNTPTHFCAWSKITLGWVEPEISTQVSNVNVLLNESSSSSFNIIKMPVGINEYFLLENRNNTGYDRGLFPISGTFQGGLAIWHIDESIISQNLSTNEVNADVSHKGVDLEEAEFSVLDSYSSAKGHEKNLYYSENSDTFNGNTAQNSNNYEGLATGVTVHSISTQSYTMTATLSNPN